MRGTSDASVIGLVSMSTSPPPQLRVTLHLKGYGEIDYIPTNRNVIVSTTAPNLRGRIVTLPVEGAYEVKVQDGRTEIRGTAGGGYVLLRFALRDESLPGHMAQADLAHFTGYVQRALREVNVPAPIGDTTAKLPIVEVLCTDASGTFFARNSRGSTAHSLRSARRLPFDGLSQSYTRRRWRAAP